jgi:hypothetical protein
MALHSESKSTRLKLTIGAAAAAGSMAFAGLVGPAGVAIAAPGDPGGGAFANDSAGGGYATGSAGGAYSREAAGGGYATGNAGGGYATGDAGGAWFKEACAAAAAAGETLPIGCAS